jgi:hypothetical protein
LCVGVFQAGDEICVGSTFKIVPNTFLAIMNTIVVDKSSFYGVDFIDSQATPMGASTLQCMDMVKEEYNVRASSITKSYTCSMDTRLATICIICNVNKSEIMLKVCPIYHNFFELLTFLVNANSLSSLE